MSDHNDATQPPQTPPVTDEIAAGHRFAGRYVIEERIGRGGFGFVYRALDTSDGRTVALKVLKRSVLGRADDPEVRARFLREASTAASLHHPHIVRIVDAGEDGGLPYLAMEYVHGRSLRQELDDRHALPLARALRVTREIASALMEAHGAGIIHRDVKPGNILLEGDGAAKLVDFGLAKGFAQTGDGPQQPSLTQDGVILGTVQYLSPEYIRGDALDGKSDVYSLGVVFYEMLAGKPPFHGASMAEVLRMHLEEEPPRLPENVGAASGPPMRKAVQELLSRMLSKSRAERPEALEVADEIDRIQSLAVDEAGRTMIVEAPSFSSEEATAETTEAPPQDPYIGMVVRDCKILSIIGEGGMGAVYKAKHVQLGTYRAVKVIRKELAAQPGFYDRFRNEALLAEQLSHPNLVKLYDFSRLDDGSLYTMWEYVEGENLEAILKRKGPFRPQETLRIMRDVLDGLALAHQHGVLHRDIALDNIMMVQDEQGKRRVKLIDFGIARSLRAPGASRQTEAGSFVGKLGYSSPEQLGDLKEGEEIDFRTDVFSLGVVMFRMLTGKFPYEAVSLTSFLRDTMTATPDRLRLMLPEDVSRDFADVVLRCLAPGRGDRFQRVEDIQHALGALDAGRTLSLSQLAAAPPPAISAAPPEPGRLRPALLAVLGAIVLFAAAFMAHDRGLADLSVLGFPARKPAAPPDARQFRMEAEMAFSAGRLVEPPGNNALDLARRVAEMEQNTVFFDGMRGRVLARLLQEGGAFLSGRERRDIERALARFGQALGLEPASVEAQFGQTVARAAMEFFAGNHENALALLEEARNLNPASPLVNLWMAEVNRGLSNRYADAGDFAGARKHRDTAQHLNPAFGPGDFRLTELEAEALTRKQREADAKTAIREAPKPPPAAPEPSRTKAAELAVESTRPAVSPATPRMLGGDDPNVLNNEANALVSAGRFRDADAKFQQALSLAPENALIRLNYAHSLFKQKRYVDTEGELRKVLQVKPDSAQAHYLLGRVALEENRLQEAEPQLRKALSFKPDEANWHFDLAEVLSDLKRFPEAEAEYLQARALGLDDFYLHLNLGNAYYEWKRYAEAAASFRRAAEKDPKSVIARYNLALALLDSGKGAEAVQELENCLRIDPNYAIAYYQMGTIHYNAGRYAQARDAFAKAVELKPDNGKAHYNLSISYQALGNAAMAETHRERACALGVRDACR